uniref:1,4-dihydroxy-2-naphthoate polyprenyltransferase n=1 Tax=Candidatus Planktophila sp. TaxID=2175601 RepID=UPI00404AF00C
MNKWIAGARPRTLPAAIAPVLVATSLAKSEADFAMAGLALVVSLALQVGVNYANDYSDGIKGTDDNRVGPTRLVASGLASAKSVKQAAFISFVVAAVVGLVLAQATSLWLIAVGAAAIFAAWTYTGSKRPYGYLGLGEISVFLFFGIVATMGSYYVQTERLTWQSFVVAIPMGSLACALLAINNLRDRAQDELVGKRTVAVRLGDSRARKLFIALLLLAHVSALAVSGENTLITLALLPQTFIIANQVRSGATGPALIPLLGKTGELQIIFAFLLALSLVMY